MTKRIATALTVLAATLVLAAPASLSAQASSDGGSTDIARGKYGCC
ncbi:MAG: hypothetical protein Q7T56_03055 [Nocardioidaceae bacterium]|nr:hypothetical protein [Nocardioidaceae bacterium]